MTKTENIDYRLINSPLRKAGCYSFYFELKISTKNAEIILEQKSKIKSYLNIIKNQKSRTCSYK